MGTHRTVHRRLHIEGFFGCTTTQESIRYSIGLVRQDRAILHHVRGFFSLQENRAAGDDDNRLHHVGIVLQFGLGDTTVLVQFLDFLTINS